MRDLIRLDRYHKQFWPKEKLKSLSKLNKTYKLGFNDKDLYDLLHLQVFEESLKNKKAFETEFDSFHQSHEDMWLNMTFNERNFFIQKDMNLLKEKLKHFTFEDTTIFIAFFNPLLNVLYGRETAILELPQYFKLSSDFNDQIESSHTMYGLRPFIADMAWPYPVAQKNQEVILFDRSIQTLFKLSLDKCERFPLYASSHLDRDLLVDLAKLLLKEDFASFYAAIEAHKLMSPRCQKKFLKTLKRRAQ